MLSNSFGSRVVVLIIYINISLKKGKSLFWRRKKESQKGLFTTFIKNSLFPTNDAYEKISITLQKARVSDAYEIPESFAKHHDASKNECTF